jgi:hypothetical protein
MSPPEEHLRYFRAFDFHRNGQRDGQGRSPKEQAIESILLP